MQCTSRVRVAWCAGVVLALVLIMPASPAAAAKGVERASERLLIPSAGWHGRPIRDPRSNPVRTVRADRQLRGWEAGPVAMGTGTHRAGGSQRVRELQWRLKALGYRPGPIDGIFGARTRAAIAWFQVKHGFTVDGRATLPVVRHLRDRTTPGDRGRERRSGAPARQAAEPLGREAPVEAASIQTRTPLWAVVGLALVAFFTAFALVARTHRPRVAAPAVAALPERSGTRAIGYVRVGAGENRQLDAHAATIEARCADQGIALAELVTDDTGDDRACPERPGLAFALRKLEAGEVDCLVVGRAGHLTRSPAELGALLDRLSERETPLVVLNADPPPVGRTGPWAGGGSRAGSMARGGRGHG